MCTEPDRHRSEPGRDSVRANLVVRTKLFACESLRDAKPNDAELPSTIQVGPVCVKGATIHFRFQPPGFIRRLRSENGQGLDLRIRMTPWITHMRSPPPLPPSPERRAATFQDLDNVSKGVKCL